MQVRSYDLLLDIDLKNFKFEARALIKLESETDVMLNSSGLNILGIKANGKSVQFEQYGENLTAKTGPFKGILEVDYTGSIPDSLVGIYRAHYNGTDMITTQFEAANARRMFPCVDNPAYKAEFKLTVKIDKVLTAISNMPIESVHFEGARKLVSFQKTPRMSTYLLYLGVGKFKEIVEKVCNIDLIVATSPSETGREKFAIEVAKKSIEFYQAYFGIPYALPKIHLIAVPEFAAGAMENWGAITFRETSLEVDEDSSVQTWKRVAETVAHELAHQWFGNLVTPRWWGDLWLNESFATFMAYKVMATTYPQWNAWHDFMINEAADAMARDSLKSTHPIEVAVKSPSDIEQVFDEISYGKGACILRMIEAYTGSDYFRKGIESYLTRHKFSNANGDDLWNSLEETSGKQLTTIMRKWVRKPGYPVVTATADKTKLKLRQERFLFLGAADKDVWPIPIIMKLNGQYKKLLLDAQEQVLAIKSIKSINLNADHTGFYRVYYKDLYDLVFEGETSALDRWGVISDALAFLMAGKISLCEYLSLVKRYNREEDYLPAREVSDQLGLLYLIIPSRILLPSIEFHKSQNKILARKMDDASSMLRGIVASRLAMIDEDYARKLGFRFCKHNKVEPDMKGAVSIAYARSYGDFEAIIKKYRESSFDEERNRLLRAMTSFKESSLVALSLGLALSGEVKRQDVASMILAATANPDVRNSAWAWIKVNIERLRKLYEGTGTLSRILQVAIPTRAHKG